MSIPARAAHHATPVRYSHFNGDDSGRRTAKGGTCIRLYVKVVLHGERQTVAYNSDALLKSFLARTSCNFLPYKDFYIMIFACCINADFSPLFPRNKFASLPRIAVLVRALTLPITHHSLNTPISGRMRYSCVAHRKNVVRISHGNMYFDQSCLHCSTVQSLLWKRNSSWSHISPWSLR
jgi:hypothetical protein